MTSFGNIYNTSLGLDFGYNFCRFPLCLSGYSLSCFSYALFQNGRLTTTKKEEDAVLSALIFVSTVYKEAYTQHQCEWVSVYKTVRKSSKRNKIKNILQNFNLLEALMSKIEWQIIYFFL